MSARAYNRTAYDDARSVWHGPKPTANRLLWSQPGNLHARPLTRPVDDCDGASAGVIVRGTEWLRRLGDDPIAGSATRVDDGRVQDVWAEAGDVEDRRVGQREVGLTVARAAPWEGPEYRRCLPGWGTPRTCRRRCVTHAPALDVWIEVCGHRRERRVRWPKDCSPCVSE